MHGTGGPLGRFTSEVPAEALRAAGEVAQALRSAKTILIAGHVGADGDVAGSSLGLACALREAGKHVVVYNEEPYPSTYSWLPGGAEVVIALPHGARFDATVVVDAAREDRLGRDFPDRERRGTYLWIDHHRFIGDDVGRGAPGDINYVDLTAAAVGEQIAAVLDAMGVPLSKDAASCLYASLLSDTGGFRYGNTSVRAFTLAARLVEAGVSPWEMTERIYESQDEAKVRLLGRTLESLWLSSCGRLGVVEVRQKDLFETGARDEHVQSLVNHVRSVRGVEIAVLLLEKGTGGIRAIVRSRGNVSVESMARRLKAAGHKNAAKIDLAMSIGEAREAIVQHALASLRRLDGLSSTIDGAPIGGRDADSSSGAE